MVDALFVIDLLSRWGYVVVFLAALIESVPFLGMLVPGQAVVMLAGFLAGQNQMELAPIIAAAILAGILGDGIGYEMGRRQGRQLLVKYGPRFRIQQAQLDKVDELFRKYGPVALVLMRFSFLTRGLGSLLAGVTRMRPAVFWSLNVAGAVVWAVFYSGLGFVFGNAVLALEGIIGRYLAFGVLAALGVYLLYRALRKANPLFTREDAYLAGLAVVAILAFARLANVAAEPGRAPLAMDAMRGALADALSGLGPLWRALDLLGDFTVIGPVILVLFVVLAWLRKYWDAALFALGLGVNELVVGTLKVVLARARPEEALAATATFAFPSGHTAAAVVLAGSAVYVLARRFPSPLAQAAMVLGGAAWITLMGLSRVALRVHYPSDVLGGFLVGVATLCTVLLVIEYAVKRTPGARAPRRAVLEPPTP